MRKYLRLTPLKIWLAEHGIRGHNVRRAIEKGSIKKHFFGKNTRAYYALDEACAFFNIKDTQR